MAEVTVYESSDLPEDDQQINDAPQAERFESEHIESVQLDVGAALQRFKGKFVSTQDADFSDSVAAKTMRGYRGGSFVVELLGSRDAPETAAERFNRLQQELLELGDQVSRLKAGSAEEEGGGVTAADVAGLQEQLKKMQVEGVLGAAASVAAADPALAGKLSHSVDQLRQKAAAATKGGASEALGTYELSVGASSLAAARATQLEARLAKLERVVGPESGLKATSAMLGSGGSSLSGAVSGLESRVALLDAGLMEAADVRLGALLTKLNSLKEKTAAVDGDEAQLIRDLYEKMQKWDDLGAALPDIVARLHALQDLHLQAMQFAQSLTQLDGTQAELSKSLSTDRQLLQETKSSMASNLDEIKKACETMEKRMKGLGK